MKLLKDLDVSGKKVFLRADLDVDVALLEAGGQKPENLMGGNGNRLAEPLRLQRLKPTVEWLLEHKAKQIFIAGHVGRPKGLDPYFSTRKLEKPLEDILRRSVTYKEDFDIDDGMLSSMAQLILLENLRFWQQEEANNAVFAKQLASIADVYVNEAFASCHRAHASIVGVPAILPHAAGLHLQEEVETLSKLLDKPERPFAAIVGGAKLETKIPVIERLAQVADKVLVGGYLPLEIQKSKSKSHNFNSKVKIALLTPDIKDIDQKSIDEFVEEIRRAKTIVWNGNLGVTEEGFEKGTVEVANAIGESGGHSIVGGGDTVEFLSSKNLLRKFSFVSSGGGAMLEFLAGKELPGIKALE